MDKAEKAEFWRLVDQLVTEVQKEPRDLLKRLYLAVKKYDAVGEELREWVERHSFDRPCTKDEERTRNHLGDRVTGTYRDLVAVLDDVGAYLKEDGLPGST